MRVSQVRQSTLVKTCTTCPLLAQATADSMCFLDCESSIAESNGIISRNLFRSLPSPPSLTCKAYGVFGHPSPSTSTPLPH